MTDLSAYYKSTSPSYDRLRFDNDDEVMSHAAWFSKSHMSSGSTLLEVGCGTGRYTKAFGDFGLRVVGLDHSIDQLIQAMRKVPVRFGSALQLPFSDQHFEFCSYIMMLHQISAAELPLVFGESHRVLRDSGCVWIKTCSHDDLRVRPLNSYFPEALEVNLKRYIDLGRLVKILEDAGFKLERTESVRNTYDVSGAEIIRRVSEKHNSTLHLISEAGFNQGLLRVKSDFVDENVYSLSHSHTLMELRK